MSESMSKWNLYDSENTKVLTCILRNQLTDTRAYKYRRRSLDAVGNEYEEFQLKINDLSKSDGKELSKIHKLFSI